MLRISVRVIGRLTKWFAVLALVLIVFAFACNLLLFPTERRVPSRALAADSPACADAAVGWDVLSQHANSEWSAIDADNKWSRKFACSIQRHVVTGAADQEAVSYDLSFIELQEDGKPYVLRRECHGGAACVVEKNISVGASHSQSVADAPQAGGQLEAFLGHLDRNTAKNKSSYVIAFIHGWRHDASIGDTDVAKLRIYAAHAARFIADRAKIDDTYKDTQVVALYVGWRGARTDENWLDRNVPWVGNAIGTASAVLTLFDRKPVSEAIAPSALAALRAIENKLELDSFVKLPRKNGNKMLVLGHSLGGNMLMTALEDDLVKKVSAHAPGQYLHPVLGDLVVLINPASEASKWTAVQRELWRRVALVNGERRPDTDYNAGHTFFRDDQRPIFVSVTAARNWPPGGRRQLDCEALTGRNASGDAAKRVVDNYTVQRIVNYDWATHDLFPAFKGDLRPLADRIEQWGTQADPHDECWTRNETVSERLKHPIRTFAIGVSESIRVLPFMQTDPEQTRTIGNLDPSRSPRGSVKNYGASARPFGTTHELRTSDKLYQRIARKSEPGSTSKELPLAYTDVLGKNAVCPMAASWLSRARQERVRRGSIEYPGRSKYYATNWDTYDLPAGASGKEGYPALRFVHGFALGGIAPPTRANDPFWNVRAFDTALAEHDGFMLSSFICALNQLVLDEITVIGP